MTLIEMILAWLTAVAAANGIAIEDLIRIIHESSDYGTFSAQITGVSETEYNLIKKLIELSGFTLSEGD